MVIVRIFGLYPRVFLHTKKLMKSVEVKSPANGGTFIHLY